QAAIALAHDLAPTWEATPWPRIAELYAGLAGHEPSAVVPLNRAAAEAMAHGPQRGLALIRELEPELADYPYLHAARADLLRRLRRADEALLAYERALSLTTNATERRFLERRLREVEGGT